MKKFYLDTSIWRDYFEDRKDNIRPLGEFAFQFLKNCKEKNHTIVFSEQVLDELKKYYSLERIISMLSDFKESIEFATVSSNQLTESKNLLNKFSETHTADILHAILARDNNAILISRDKHFEQLQHIVEVKKPEEITFD